MKFINGEWYCIGITSVTDHWQKIAGKVEESSIAGQGFLHIAVYNDNVRDPSFTAFVNITFVHDIVPCTEDVARQFQRE